MKKIYLIIPALTLAMFFISCSGSSNEQKQEKKGEEITEVSDESTPEMEMPSESEFELNLIIANNIASPVKLLTDMSQAGVSNFDESLLLPMVEVSAYPTSNEKALAFGAYGADFSYVAINDQSNLIPDYLITIDKLADDLGMSPLFDPTSFQKFDQIKENPDSVKLFIFGKYDEADGFLRENDRKLMAALVLTGGLIESLHLVSSQIENGEATKEAYMIFLEQKNTMKNLISLFEAIEKDGNEVPVKADLENLYKQFKEVNSFEVFNKENVAPLHVAIDEVRESIL